jgi:hypothetical protein
VKTREQLHHRVGRPVNNDARQRMPDGVGKLRGNENRAGARFGVPGSIAFVREETQGFRTSAIEGRNASQLHRTITKQFAANGGRNVSGGDGLEPVTAVSNAYRRTFTH